VAGTAHRPRRTCVGCRTTTEADGLLRLALAGTDAVVPDVRRRLGGRGAWLHADPACLVLAVRRRALPRALRVPGPLSTDAVAEHLAAADGRDAP
jgi:predicted RNA-binding protein YlxR (DUF448 family)